MFFCKKYTAKEQVSQSQSLQYRKGLPGEMKWEVEVLNTTVVDGAWYEDSVVRLRHVTTGQYLGATDSRYPDTDCTVLYCTVQVSISGPRITSTQTRTGARD